MSGDGKKLTLSMVVHNEADRYLRRALEAHRAYIDEAVIIDDGSTDESVELCREVHSWHPAAHHSAALWTVSKNDRTV